MPPAARVAHAAKAAPAKRVRSVQPSHMDTRAMRRSFPLTMQAAGSILMPHTATATAHAAPSRAAAVTAPALHVARAPAAVAPAARRVVRAAAAAKIDA